MNFLEPRQWSSTTRRARLTCRSRVARADRLPDAGNLGSEPAQYPNARQGEERDQQGVLHHLLAVFVSPEGDHLFHVSSVGMLPTGLEGVSVSWDVGDPAAESPHPRQFARKY